MNKTLEIKRLAVIGCGLIGGSLALALRHAGVVGEIVGGGRSESSLQHARMLGIIDRYETDLARAVAGADVVMLSVPLAAMRPVMEGIQPGLAADALVTDGGSAKASVIADARAVFGERIGCFVPGHPIAGTERSGPEAAFRELYRERRVILTPLAENREQDVQRIARMWQAAGAEVECMDASHHDHVLAATSHLPHMLAFGLVDCLAGLEETREIFRYAAGGFADFTRIASSDPVMWRDISLKNRDELLAMFDRFEDEMRLLREAIGANDGEALLQIFSRAKAARDRFTRQMD